MYQSIQLWGEGGGPHIGSWGTNNLNHDPNLLIDNKKYGVKLPTYTLSL